MFVHEVCVEVRKIIESDKCACRSVVPHANYILVFQQNRKEDDIMTFPSLKQHALGMFFLVKYLD